MTDTKYSGVPSGELTGDKTDRIDEGLIKKIAPEPLIIQYKPWKKYFMAVWAILECMFFGGLVYGWASLVFVLKKEGLYADLCQHGPANSSNLTLTSPNNTDHHGNSCAEQDEKLSLAFTVGTSLMTFSSPFMGHIQYTFGTRVARLVMLCFLLCGSLVIAFLDTSTPYLIYIGLSCVAIGGLPVLVTNIQVANLFIVGGSTVVGVLSGSLDVSATVQLLVKIAYENGVSRKTSYLFISALQVMILISTFLWLPKTVLPKAECGVAVVEKELDKEETELSEKNNRNGPLVSETDEPVLRVVPPSLLDCALSRIFLSHVSWLSILQLRFYYFLSSLNPWLNYITEQDDQQVSHFTNVSLFIQLAGIFTSLLCGFIFDLERRRNQGKRTITERRLQPSVIPQAVTSLLALLLSVLVLIPNTQVLYVDFIVLTFVRSFMYGMGAAFIQMVFPAEYFGSLYGIMVVITGIVSALQYPLFMWMEAPPRGPQKVNIFLLVLMLFSLIHPLHIWLTCRSADKKAVKTANIQEESEYVFISKRSGCR